MNFQTQIPKTDPIVKYLTASVKIMEKTDLRELKAQTGSKFGIKMHAAVLASEYQMKVSTKEAERVMTSKKE